MAVDANRYTYASNGTGQRWGLLSDRAGSQLHGTAIGSNGLAFVVGVNGLVRRSSYTDLFFSWTAYTVRSGSTQWFDVSTPDGVNVIVVGGSGAAFYSNSSGDSWFAGVSGTSNNIRCVRHANGSTYFAMSAGDNGFLAKTENGGLSWTSMTAFPTTYSAQFKTLSVLSVTEAYVAAQSGSIDPKGLIYRTLDGGSTWTLMGSVSNSLTSLAMYNSDFGVAGVVNGAVVYALVAAYIATHNGTIIADKATDFIFTIVATNNDAVELANDEAERAAQPESVGSADKCALGQAE
eukprot:gene26812-32397_t